MAKNYIVVLDSDVNDPCVAMYPKGYFPRGFHYKRDADALVDEVVGRCGKAHVVPKSQF